MCVFKRLLNGWPFDFLTDKRFKTKERLKYIYTHVANFKGVKANDGLGWSYEHYS